jgi:hypothetical protein
MMIVWEGEISHGFPDLPFCSLLRSCPSVELAAVAVTPASIIVLFATTPQSQGHTNSDGLDGGLEMKLTGERATNAWRVVSGEQVTSLAAANGNLTPLKKKFRFVSQWIWIPVKVFPTTWSMKIRLGLQVITLTLQQRTAISNAAKAQALGYGISRRRSKGFYFQVGHFYQQVYQQLTPDILSYIRKPCLM